MEFAVKVKVGVAHLALQVAERGKELLLLAQPGEGKTINVCDHVATVNHEVSVTSVMITGGLWIRFHFCGSESRIFFQCGSGSS